jgi:hypothetical protein
MLGGKTPLVGDRILGAVMSAEVRRKRAVAEREESGGWRWELAELVRIGVRKEGEGVGRPACVREVESWAGVIGDAIL